METTINGQLLLTLLIERLLTRIGDIQLLQANTDGITVRIHKKYVEEYYNICKEWEELTKFTLEYAEYSKMVIRDVNNYLSVYTNGKVKYKGDFEIDKEIWKDSSMRIVPFALSKYFIEGVPIEDTIYNHTNIFDFYKRNKLSKGSRLVQRYFDKEVIDTELTKTTRYIVTNSGYSLIKILPPMEGKLDKLEKIKINSPNQVNLFDFVEDTTRIDINREVNIEAGWLCTVYNKHVDKPINEYDINYDYYIKECYKIINTIIN